MIEIINNVVNGGESVNVDKIDQIALSGKLIPFVENVGNKLDLMNALEAGGYTDITVDEIIAKIPNFNLWGFNLADTPKVASWLILIPILAAGFQWLTMFISRKVNGNAQMATADQQTQASMKMMDFIFPAMTIWLTFSFSAMMGLYWIYQSVLGIVQILILGKLMPIPKYTAEELKAMQKAAKAKQKEQNAIIKTQPKYKSLHYIDEDDYDELPEVKTTGKKNNNNQNGSTKPEIKD